MQRTIKNLAMAFVGESQARNRYTMYAKVAKKEGFEQVAELFLLTADNEREHAKWLFRMINDLKQKSGDDLACIKVEAEVPTVLGSTTENLKASIAGENHETVSMYPGFADVADEEGLSEVASRLRAIGQSEKHHENRFKKLLKEVEAKAVFKKEKAVYWVCRKCGYLHEGTEPPEECPSCSHPSNYFEVQCETY